MGKGKMIELEKLKKVVAFPLQTGGAFKIYEPKAPVPPESPTAPLAKKSPILTKKLVEFPSRVARAFKLVDEEEDLEIEQPAEAILGPTPQVSTPAEESEVEVIEVPFVKKRKLKKVVEPAAPVVEPVAPVVKLVAVVVEAMNVASFLVARRKQIPPPSVPCMADVEAFLANEPVEAVLVNVAELNLEELIQVLGGRIPSILNHLLGLNIQHILEDINMDSEESIKMADDNMGPSTAVATKTPRKPLSPIPEVGATSRDLTPKRPRSLIPIGVDGASGSKRP
jgi:hypothetical protein